jgi:hypothetical protein
VGLAFLGSPWLLSDRNLNGFVRHDVINRQFDELTLVVLAAPIRLVFDLLLGAISTNAHNLLILKESAISTIRI